MLEGWPQRCHAVATPTGTYELYRITNAVNGNAYVRITSRGTEVRWREHKCRVAQSWRYKSPFYRALRKYGIDAFRVAVLKKDMTEEEAKTAEILLIAQERPKYNGTAGGDGATGHRVSVEARQRMREAHLGNKYNLGRQWTADQRHAMSAKKKGCAPPPESPLMRKTRVENCIKSTAARRKRIWCLNTGEVFASGRDAAAFFKIHHTAISAIARGCRPSINGLVFRFAT